MEKEKIKPEHPSPLKGKLFTYTKRDGGFALVNDINGEVCLSNGVRAAVEWLKDKYNQIEKHHYGFWDDELKKIYEGYTDVYMFNKYEFKLWLLDKAFEDVVKNE